MGIFLVPYNEHNFILEAIEKYYSLKPIEGQR
jgi:hypothetical protein